MGMGKRNSARWTKNSRGQGWILFVDFERHWEAPKVGSGLGAVIEVDVYKKGSPTPTVERVELTSRVFGNRKTGRPAAFAEVV